MPILPRILPLSIFVLLLCAPVSSPAQTENDQKLSPEEKYKKGHSAHGEAFDVGPREKPWPMDGLTITPFPITTKNAEAQKWFDQGVTLLHSFWFYEAERAFRWCLKLDPDCAMAYWGLARAADDEKRTDTFLKEAIKRKDKVSERERMYIEAWAARMKTDIPEIAGGNKDSSSKRNNEFRARLERIVMKYPDDLEAKTLLALENLANNRMGTELLLRQVLAKNPNHPGAHHYRIHNWDGKDGGYALDSCAIYGSLAMPVGHAQHMPGHIYSDMGMWHEAAIAMDAATRAERQYMLRRMAFPFNTWNYAHNQNYLTYIQTQLGMAEAAISGARQLLAAPLDPKYNNNGQYSIHHQGQIALMRALIRFERWKDLLDDKAFSWQDNARDKMNRAYCEALAHLGLNDKEKAAKRYAAYAALKDEISKPDNKWLEQTYKVQGEELKAMHALTNGEEVNGLSILSEAARLEAELHETFDDPPFYPTLLYNTLGRAYLARKSPALAIAAFEKALTVVANDGFALSGLVEAYFALGEKEKARDFYARLLHVWSEADPGLKLMGRVKVLGLRAEPKDSSPAKQRNYKRTPLDQYGPGEWAAYAAPKLDAIDTEKKRVTLEEYRGKNVVLIFYIGQSCSHCVGQLKDLGKRAEELKNLGVEVLAASSNTPEENAGAVVKDMKARLLSDGSFENARRFKSYDDFEDIPLHSTILIDKLGRVHWARHGGAPFTDFDFLLKEIKRLNELQEGQIAGTQSTGISSAEKSQRQR
ncbi:MAG: redoxin domain-containing protein [Acidobacteria bacterium]|nr:redoxin domain-containing protein [Acidobacteriota bacterium]